MYSDTECTRRTGSSIRSCHSSSLSNRYIRGYGSNQDLSKRTQFLSSPSISDIIYSKETFPILAEFLQIHGRESLVGFCAIVIGISNLTLDKRQALYAVRAAYKQYINDETISNSWLQSTTRELIRQQISQRTLDPYKIFQPAMKDMLQYIKQNFYSNFLSSQIWKNYLNKQQQQDKRIKGINASTPKKMNSSISTSTVKSSKQNMSKRDILTSFNANKTLGKDINYKFLGSFLLLLISWRILRIALFTLLGVVLICTAGLIAFFVIRNQRNRKQLSKGPNKIILLPDDIMFVMPKGSIFTSKVNLKNEAHERSNASIRSEEIQAGKTARYNGDLVEVKKLHIGPLSLRTKVMRELRQLKDLRHENVNTFIGLFIDQNAPALIYEYGHRGSLEDILKKEEIKLDWNFKWSMLNDLVRGMRYLSNSPIRCHGNLKSRNCIVDSRWVLKVTDYHLNEMYSLQNAPRQVDITDLLWMSPEHIRTSIIKNDVATVMTSSAAGDVYSFGIIMQEVILRGPPFCMLDLTPQGFFFFINKNDYYILSSVNIEIIAKIKKPPPLLRPSVSKQVAPPEYINSMKQCWAEQAETRPSFNDLAQSIKLLNGGK
ncbi:unnamed protein product [Rotaria sp. Silwood2]|nr:unnamed protein product [Rotaria sp. Silwood2]